MPNDRNSSLHPQDVEISDDVFLIQRELAEAHKAVRIITPQDAVVAPPAAGSSGTTGTSDTSPATDDKSPLPAHSSARVEYSGSAPKVDELLYEGTLEVRRRRRVEAYASSGSRPVEGVSSQKVDEMRVALRELGLKDSLEGE
jgi:hypothetical protein